jgi:hypothetical protein
MVPHDLFLGCLMTTFRLWDLPNWEDRSNGLLTGKDLKWSWPFQGNYTVTWHVFDYTWGLEWWIDLLTTYTHDSALQAITAPLLISTLYSSLEHTAYFSQSVTTRFLVTASTMPIPLPRAQNPLFTGSCTELTLNWLIRSQSYFMAGGLPPINSPWRQATWVSWSNWTFSVIVLT